MEKYTDNTALNMYIEQCDRIRNAYGSVKQELQTVQELAELAVLLTRRDDQRRIAHRGEVIAECCDVMIMVQQMLRMYGATREEVSRTVEWKIARQFDRMQDEALRYDP